VWRSWAQDRINTLTVILARASPAVANVLAELVSLLNEL
jgi:hypothetical protein